MKLQTFKIQKFLGKLYLYLFGVNSLHSALNKDGNYYPQVFLKECKYIKKKNY